MYVCVYINNNVSGELVTYLYVYTYIQLSRMQNYYIYLMVCLFIIRILKVNYR